MTTPRLVRLKHLSSVRFTVALLILIVIASILGTVIPQNRGDEEYRARYGDIFSRILVSLQLTDVYHSYWYRALLAVFPRYVNKSTMNNHSCIHKRIHLLSVAVSTSQKLKNKFSQAHG